VGYVPVADLREANDRATDAERAAKRSQSEVDELTQVMNGKNKELEDIIEDHKKALAAALKEKDGALAAAAAHEKQLAAVRKAHEAELEMEREASSSTIVALQKERTSFEAFVCEMSRQLLGKGSFFFLCLFTIHKCRVDT
jgi:hypothetical protein